MHGMKQARVVHIRGKIKPVQSDDENVAYVVHLPCVRIWEGKRVESHDWTGWETLPGGPTIRRCLACGKSVMRELP